MRKLPSLPAVHLAGVHEAQRRESVQASAEEAAAEDAAEKARNAGDPGAPVQAVDAVRGMGPPGGLKGARSHVIRKRKPRKKKDVAAPGAIPPDPRGLGTSIDLKA